MALYTRQQLVLLLALLGAACVGLGVTHWRATHPQLVERLEALDRDIAASTDAGAAEEREVTAAPSAPAARRARRAAEADSRPAERTRTSKRQRGLDETGPPLDLNHATLTDLVRLPGVGPVLARRILETRGALGRFAAVDDLVSVRGLGRTKLDRLRPLVGVVE